MARASQWQQNADEAERAASNTSGTDALLLVLIDEVRRLANALEPLLPVKDFRIKPQ